MSTKSRGLSKEKAPVFRVTVSRRKGAPTRPTRPALEQLFAWACDLLPASRRSALPATRSIAVDLIVMDDAEIAELNYAHLGHTGPTDVLAFPMRDEDRERRVFLLGEIAVSHETAAREAAARRLPVTEELSRYAVHGFLHLLGLRDDTAGRRKELHAFQEEALGLSGIRKPDRAGRSR